MSPRLWKRGKKAPAVGGFDSPAAQDEIASLARILSSDVGELDGEEAEFQSAVVARLDDMDKATAEYVARLSAEGVSLDEAFSIVQSETHDRSLATRVTNDLWARQIGDLDDQALLALADEVAKGPPEKAKVLALDAERARRGLPSESPLDLPARDGDPSWTPEEARFMSANARYWELNERVSTGAASPREIEDWQQAEIELARASTAMNSGRSGSDPASNV